MYFNQSNKVELTDYQKRVLGEDKRNLKNLEKLGKKGSQEWWTLAESIDAMENNL